MIHLQLAMYILVCLYNIITIVVTYILIFSI